MNVILSIDEQLLARALKKADLLRTSLEELILNYLEALASDESEHSIEELKRLSSQGDSRGWRFNRDEIHE